MVNRSRAASRRKRQQHARQLAPVTGDAAPIIIFLLLASATGGVDARSPTPGGEARGAGGGGGEAATMERVGGAALGGACLEHLRAARLSTLFAGGGARRGTGNAARGRQLSGCTRRRLGRAVGWGLRSGEAGAEERRGRQRLGLRGGGDGVVLSDTLYVTGLPPFANEVLALPEWMSSPA